LEIKNRGRYYFWLGVVVVILVAFAVISKFNLFGWDVNANTPPRNNSNVASETQLNPLETTSPGISTRIIAGPSKSTNSNPIDSWLEKMVKQYENPHIDGWLAYTYENAWKAELQNLVKKNNTQTGKKYFDSIVKKAEAKRVQEVKAENRVGWSTGSSGRVGLACAEVYKKGLFQFDAHFSDYKFDPDGATKEFIKGIKQ